MDDDDEDDEGEDFDDDSEGDEDNPIAVGSGDEEGDFEEVRRVQPKQLTGVPRPS